MQEKISEKTFDGQSIYVGIDVHKKDWKITIMTNELSYKTFSSVPNAEKLNGYLKSNFPGATFYSAIGREDVIQQRVAEKCIKTKKASGFLMRLFD